jgi:hypothetical protein
MNAAVPKQASPTTNANPVARFVFTGLRLAYFGKEATELG